MHVGEDAERLLGFRVELGPIVENILDELDRWFSAVGPPYCAPAGHA